ncbi:OLC1v1028408C1 [Oldenlandia corymbosa var. corymbosa]|uniref:OLC1v1028408C1 n=1 Tax=Oldenlandia corymbosa var. corymbosa TaxID=529605 RepID=A0AAV1CBN3_OLDCO|nr:OLC1v1028408C1 [Oldenlandia corymbosa var. corymbosa]
MAVALGKIALILDPGHVTSPRICTLPDRKSHHRPAAAVTPILSDIVLNLFKIESFDGGDVRKEKYFVKKGKGLKSKVDAVDYENSSDDENGNGNGYNGDGDEEGENGFDWEKEMRKRVKEIEEFRELEKKAEEVQNRVDEEFKESGEEDKEETEEEKRMRVRKELEKVAKEQAERRKMAELMFDLGQKAYGRGTYGRAIEFLEAALTIIPRPTLFGGEIQIWLAMAYEANNRHADCIALYKQLEQKHPSVSIRRQAAELRYILQAPKIKITQEEMVSIPLIGSSYDSYAGTWSDKYKDKDEKRSYSTTNQLPSNRDYLGDLLQWKPPIGLEKSQTFWIALTLWVGLVGAALFLQN